MRERSQLESDCWEQNEAKVADFPSHGPPWGEDKADWMLGELEKILLADGKDPARDWLCGPEFRSVYKPFRASWLFSNMYCFSQADICATVMVDRLAMYGYEGKVWGNGGFADFHPDASFW